MKSLELLDDLVRTCRDFPYPDLLKDALTLRAQFVYDIAQYRELVPVFPAPREDDE